MSKIQTRERKVNCGEETGRECDKYIESEVKDMMDKRSGKKHSERVRLRLRITKNQLRK